MITMLQPGSLVVALLAMDCHRNECKRARRLRSSHVAGGRRNASRAANRFCATSRCGPAHSHSLILVGFLANTDRPVLFNNSRRFGFVPGTRPCPGRVIPRTFSRFTLKYRPTPIGSPSTLIRCWKIPSPIINSSWPGIPWYFTHATSTSASC